MESHVVKTDAVYKRLWFLWGYWRLFLRFSWILAIFLQFVRFCCMKDPNAWIKFFVAICSAFQHFPLGIKYFLTLLNPLFPRVPVLTVVKYGVKNASWPGAAGVCRSRPGSVFFVDLGLGYCTSSVAVRQVFSARQAYQFFTRLFKE